MLPGQLEFPDSHSPVFVACSSSSNKLEIPPETVPTPLNSGFIIHFPAAKTMMCCMFLCSLLCFTRFSGELYIIFFYQQRNSIGCKFHLFRAPGTVLFFFGRKSVLTLAVVAPSDLDRIGWGSFGGVACAV